MHPHATRVLSRLDQARASLGISVDAVPASLRQERPAPERWSVAEVLEHLVLVERRFIDRIADAVEAARTAGLGAETDHREPLPDAVEARMADRVNTRSAPDAVKPTGTLDAAAAWLAVEQGHRRLRGIVGDAEGFALSQVTLDHHIFGSLTVYQWVELIGAHESRHTMQIAEIGAALAGR